MSNSIKSITLGGKKREGNKITFNKWVKAGANTRLVNNLNTLGEKLNISWDVVLEKEKTGTNRNGIVTVFGEDAKGQKFFYDNRLHTEAGTISVTKVLGQKIAETRKELGIK